MGAPEVGCDCYGCAWARAHRNGAMRALRFRQARRIALPLATFSALAMTGADLWVRGPVPAGIFGLILAGAAFAGAVAFWAGR